MTSFLSMPLNRRSALKPGTGIGLAGAAGLVGLRSGPTVSEPAVQPVDVLARDFVNSLDAEQRADTCVEYEHPLRQYHIRGVFAGIKTKITRRSRRSRTRTRRKKHFRASCSS